MFGYYDHNMLVMSERISEHLPTTNKFTPKQRLWYIRAKEVIISSGSIERPLVFGNNDTPGVILSSAAKEYLKIYGVLVGKRPLVPATGARLTIPVENIANFISTYFVADAIRNASNDALYKNEDREEIINSILRTTNLDFVHNENILPEEFSLPNKPKKPTSNKEAKEYARKVISTRRLRAFC